MAKINSSSGLQDYDINSLYKAYGGGSSTGGGYSVAKADISGLLSAYDKQAETARQTAESKYNNTRNDLLTSLKRFQDENARNVQNQKTSYLTEQASLESAREQANRQNRISAAARGIGGSGLQQLAQLQNLIGQSEQVSKSAGANQEAMNRLATLLRNYEEDSDTKMKLNEEERANTLNSIASTLASQKAAAIAQNEQNYVNAVNQARAQAAVSRASSSLNNLSALQTANSAQGALSLWQSQLQDELKQAQDNSGKMSRSAYTNARNKIKNKYMDQLVQLQDMYGLNSGTINTAKSNLNSLLDYYSNRIVPVNNTKDYDWLNFVLPGYGTARLIDKLS